MANLKQKHHQYHHFMAHFAIFLILNSFLIVAAQQRQFNITRGLSLTPIRNSSWLSPSGLYAFGFYRCKSGFAVGVFIAGIPQKTVVWTANRDSPPVSSNATLLFTSDGRLILQSAQGQDTRVTSASESASLASISDLGNFVLYGSDRQIIWQSFSNPTDTLLPSQTLKAGTELISSVSEDDQSSWIFRLKMQHDGNLVQYPVNTPDTAPYAYWSSGTYRQGDNVTLNLDPDGHLYLLNATDFNVHNVSTKRLPTENTINMMKLDSDGIFRIYSHNLRQNGSWSVEWQSTDDKCDPKGLCGLNSFCVMNDAEAACECLPGFAPVNQWNLSAGCVRDFTAESCKEKNGSIAYTMEDLPKTIWEDVSYTVLSLSTDEDCRNACLNDCNCEAALYDGQCRKQRLPLRYGRRRSRDSNTAFIKVGQLNTHPLDGMKPPQAKEKVRKDILIIVSSFLACALFLLAIFGIVTHRNHVWSYETIHSSNNNRTSEEVGPKSFTYSQLEKVTDGFKEEIGRGSFGTVYKGVIRNTQQLVAVKKLDKVLKEGEKEFQNEINVIGKTHHKNLVRLLGYCLDGPNRLLVYEYMSNGSLADVLFSPENKPCFIERIQIARNIARGLLYLHDECETQIIHCDIKPQNILMDEYRCPRIADFGLAKLLKPDQTRTFTGIRGTKGYVAPEWHRNMPVTVKADVYSFGIVLLEILCCRRNVDFSLPEEEAILEEKVYNSFVDGELEKLVSPEEVDMKQLERMVKVGLWCTLDEPSLRPSMKKVLLMLEGTVDIPAPPSPTSFLTAL